MVSVQQSFGIAQLKDSAQRGFLGVSVCSRLFSKKRVLEISEWATKRFSRFLFLVADDPQAYTFMATRGLDYESALQKARKIGDERHASLSKWLRHVTVGKFSIMRWQEVASDGEFQNVLASVEYCFRNVDSFREAVVNQVHSRNRSLPDDFRFARISERRLDVACMYVVHELAVMVYLQEHARPSWPVQVFPLPMPPALVSLYDIPCSSDLALHQDRSGYIEIDTEHQLASCLT